MFDIGFWEFAMVGVIVLIVVGPEKMPAVARKAGHYIGKIKTFVKKMSSDFETELESDKLKNHLKLQDEGGDILEILKDTKNTLDDARSNEPK